MMLSKNVNNKKCAPKLIFFNEKKIEKDSDNFWYRKLTLKVGRLGDFALFDTSPLVQFSKFKNFLWVCWFLGKNLSNFVPPIWKLHNPYCHNGPLHSSNFRALTPVLGAMKKFKLFYQSKTACLKFMEIQQIREKKTFVAMQDKRLMY